jgi:hypothetical protein
MAHSVRPIKAFVLRLWREPGAQEGDAGWRGLLRPLGAGDATTDENEVVFLGLEELLDALRRLLADEETLAGQGRSPR